MELYSFLPLDTFLKMKDLVFRFPSPYGVIFILTYEPGNNKRLYIDKGFRLLMELYSFLPGGIYHDKNIE